eukprot:762500-Hanusia_phi.AAC.1
MEERRWGGTVGSGTPTHPTKAIGPQDFSEYAERAKADSAHLLPSSWADDLPPWICWESMTYRLPVTPSQSLSSVFFPLRATILQCNISFALCVSASA